MPTYRIGIGSEFNLKDRKIGIGSDSPTRELDVSGTTSVNRLSVSGIATFARYSGLYSEDNNANITISSGDYITPGDIVVGVGETFTVSTGATISIGTVESVSIGTHFSPPVGGVEERPEAPVEGTVRYNTDLNTLEFYNGVEWRQFTVNGASGRGVYGPTTTGGSATRQIHALSTITQGEAVDWGQLSAGNYAQNAACGSATRIIFGGGTPYASPWPVSNEMDYKAIASHGNTRDFGNLTDARRALTALSSSTRGIFIGGVTPTTRNVMDYVEISTTGNALDFGDSMTTGRYYQSGCSSSTRGLVVHGNPNNRDYIEVLNIASKGNTTKFGNRLFHGGYTTGCSNGVRAIFAGGYNQNPVAGNARGDIGRVTIATDGNEISFGDLTVARYHAIGLANSTRGLICGGGPSPTVSTIDSIQFESNGGGVNFGDINEIGYAMAGTSDSHGGLGGY